jgi:F-box/leucine-rich repeat protein 2/20
VAVPCGVRPGSAGSPTANVVEVVEDADDYFCDAQAEVERERRPNFNFWHDMPRELRFHILRLLTPRQLVRCSRVSKSWHDMCFDGQMWSSLDATHYYREIPAESLANIITKAGPFVRDLNLRGCVQLREHWMQKEMTSSCKNIEYICVEGCMVGSKAIQRLLFSNSRLVHINLSGLQGANNYAMTLIAEHCPKVEYLNIAWCSNVDTTGLRAIVEGCAHLLELRAGDTGGWDDTDFALEVFERNTLERLALTNCESLTDEALETLMVGRDGEIDYMTDRVVCPPRRLRHLDLTRCRRITDAGLQSLAHNVPDLETLQLCKCVELTDASLAALLPTVPRLTHLDLEEVEQLTNASLQALSTSPAAPTLRHLSVSYCEALGDAGLLPVVRRCPRLECLDADNTRASDLVLVEAAAAQLERNRAAARVGGEPGVKVALRLVVYDCGNVTWTGVREVLSRNAEVAPGGRRQSENEDEDGGPNYPHGIVALKAFYTWQQTVNEHNRRTLAGAFSRANRLERKWAAFMMAGEEQAAAAGGGGGGGGIMAGAGGGTAARRRRRRVREALEAVAGEEGIGNADVLAGGAVRRRRARSAGFASVGGACVVM